MSKLITQLKVGDILRYPSISLSDKLTNNYLSFSKFREWFIGNNDVFKQSKTIEFSNLSNTEYDNQYLNYTNQKNNKKFFFDTSVCDYTTYRFIMDSFPDSQSRFANLIKNRTLADKVNYHDIKTSLCILANKTDNIKPHSLVNIFKKYEYLNQSGNKEFLITEIGYTDSNTFKLRCSSSDGKFGSIIKHIHSQHNFVLKNLDVELMYFQTPNQTKQAFCEIYESENFKNFRFKIIN